MSSMMQMLLASKGKTTVSSSVSGSGTLVIPAGVTRIDFNGQGGSGTSPALTGNQTYFNTYEDPGTAVGNTYGLPGSSANDASPLSGTSTTWYVYDTNSSLTNYNLSGVADLSYPYSIYSKDYTAAITGPSTTATFESNTQTWTGTNYSGYPSAEDKSMTSLSGAGGSLSYDVASGTILYYTYTY